MCKDATCLRRQSKLHIWAKLIAPTFKTLLMVFSIRWLLDGYKIGLCARSIVNTPRLATGNFVVVLSNDLKKLETF